MQRFHARRSAGTRSRFNGVSLRWTDRELGIVAGYAERCHRREFAIMGGSRLLAAGELKHRSIQGIFQQLRMMVRFLEEQEDQRHGAGVPWAETELSLARLYGQMISERKCSYYRAMHEMHARLPHRTPQACRAKVKDYVQR